jgi:hypothetical protein
MQRFGQGLNVFKLERRARGAAVEDLQRGDFVFVLADEVFKALHQLRCPVAAYAEAGFHERVLCHRVYHQVCLLLHLQQVLAQRG